MRASVVTGFLAIVLFAGSAQALAAKEKPTTPAGCSASASCGSNRIRCSTSGSGSCQGVDRNCSAGQRGFVTCGSTTTYCPPCPSSLPPCETYCSCSVPCFTSSCDGGGGFVQDCADWGICATSCYCGGECLVTGDSTARWTGTGSCTASPDDLLSKIFS